MKKILVMAAALFSLSSCTEQKMVRSFGGTMEIKLPKGEKLMTATWKKASLFYLTEPMDSGYIPKRKRFKEDSGFGIWESEIIFVESK